MNAVVALALVAMIMPAQAQLVSTGDALALDAGNLGGRVEAYLLRDDVAAELAELGVSHEMAMARVANLSAAELEQITGRIDQMPAAGDGVIVVLGVVFLVLIILELVGVTNIFRR
ncbi:MAG: PA2779 family protein [Wenzhouxiangellaceae bacterium]|nr:PA2779 family protein [Wenzhouxiangellaceae bacterium]